VVVAQGGGAGAPGLLEDFESTAINLGGDPHRGGGWIFQRNGSNAWMSACPVNAPLAEIETSFPPGMELQRIVDVADTVARSIQLTWNKLARCGWLLVLLVAAGALGNSPTGPWSALWGSRLPWIGSITVLRSSGSFDHTLTLFGMVARHRTLWWMTPLCQRRHWWRAWKARRIADAAARNAMPGTGVPVIATPWCWCWSFPAGAGHSGSVPARLNPTDRESTIGATILFSTLNALTLPPVAASLAARPCWKEPRLAEPALQRPNAGWTGCATGTAKALERSFRRRRLVLLDYSAGWCWRAGPWPVLPPASSPERRQPGCGASWCSPGGGPTAQPERGGGRFRQVVGRKKSWCGSVNF